MTELACAWPPTGEQRGHLAILAELIRVSGAERFLGTRLVRADQRDFPEAWEPTIGCLTRLVHRLLWHAYLDLELAIEDVRPAGFDDKMLQTSEIEIASVANGLVTFQVASIGNDNVAGLLGHKVGEAFLDSLPGEPFRDRPATAAEDPARASIAACYLGLGVLVANSSLYRRHASRFVGNYAVSENRVDQAGGLSIGDATFLLAVQDVLREDHQDALATLLGPQAEWFARWVEVLEPHEDELRTLLELPASVGALALTRAPAPVAPAMAAERDLTKFNAGLTTFRVPVRARRWLAGAGLGLVAALVGRVVHGEAVELLLAIPAGAVVGLAFRKGGFWCADPQCARWMPQELAVCPGCGGTIRATIKHANLRLDKLEELEPPAE